MNNEIERTTSTTQPKREIAGIMSICALLLGVYFGIVLTKSEVVRWQRVHDMFLFRELHMYLIIGVGIAVAAVSMMLIKALKLKSIDNKPIVYQPKRFHKGVIFGGMLFGAGWAITGSCPGPIYAQIGAGAWPALFTFGGAMLGTFVYAVLFPRLPH
ncbi:MAG TPA: YeeE/YedE thiosulfate transporter family protein [Pirellulaceae bacterium]|nr:YeeE/YedE thiosulfate transporter family protein [Pirellulaceae bacterium]HMO92820.1 YeeE/YedE thiosulfate transporter family protein [Pirellulaceae bacterium]HMP69437.1 YeeE/YedE thiosulfate transporter family protein [Pirellulaceae bacterium]